MATAFSRFNAPGSLTGASAMLLMKLHCQYGAWFSGEIEETCVEDEQTLIVKSVEFNYLEVIQ